MRRWLCTLGALIACGGSVATGEPGTSTIGPSLPEGDTAGEANAADGTAEISTANGWVVSSVPAKLYSGDIAIMVDALGQPHVAYGASGTAPNDRGPLHHAWMAGKRWQQEPIEPDEPYDRGSRKAWVRGSVEPRLVYTDVLYSSRAYQALYREAGGWEVETLLYAEDSGAMTAVWHDDRLLLARMTSVREDVPQLGSMAPRLGLSIDGRALPIEFTELAPEDGLPMLALAVDSSGAELVAYATQTDWIPPIPELTEPRTDRAALSEFPLTVVRFVSHRDGEWSVPVDLSPTPSAHGGLSLDVDPQGTAHVVFTVRQLGGDTVAADDLKEIQVIHHMSRRPGESWSRDLIGGIGSASMGRGSMAIDARGGVHVVYCRIADASRGCDAVGHAVLIDGEWTTEDIESGCDDLGGDAAVAVGADGTVFVAYRGCDRELRIARKS